MILRAAVEAGAPADIIGWLDSPTVEMADQLIHHPQVDLILATGGPGRVKASYSSGKPAIGVGAGNTPVVVDETADINRMVASVLMSKTFDNGMICASEQSVIVVDAVYDEVRARFAAAGGYLLPEPQRQAVRNIIMKQGRINADIVGQSALKIAEMAGIEVPADTKVLISEVSGIGDDEPFSGEKLSPLLGMYRAQHFDDAINKAVALAAFGGAGHTSCLYTDQDNQQARIARFGARLKTSRILINTPASQGGIGDLYNFKLPPSMTLGCGSWGGNSVSENIGPKHLLNRKTVAKRAEKHAVAQAAAGHLLPPRRLVRRAERGSSAGQSQTRVYRHRAVSVQPGVRQTGAGDPACARGGNRGVRRGGRGADPDDGQRRRPAHAAV
ncbi:Aldehyde-alcohol dehydrogenase [Serratia rubidaea]|uniref:Aldehyde-alcohol dehydrogenase n=1 Tax=Serratia rubidaea TaxID=61652 RepID=A0A4U9H7N9_SERRU|nr:Aldehyde-alcohol dehydrogenase [Serratia rubidaea]